MKTLHVRALIGLLVAAIAAASLSSCTDQTFSGGRYEQPIFTAEVAATAIEYRVANDYTGAPKSLKLDIWQPAGDTATRRPAMVWIFGGAFVAGNRASMNSYAQDSAKRGYVGVTIDYRLDAPPTSGGLGGINFARAATNAYDDSLAAVQWLQAHAADYRIDVGTVVVGGYSAGAINALHVAAVPSPPPVAGVVSIAGMTFNAALGGGNGAFGVPRPGNPPFIMFGGTADTTVPFASQQKTCEDQKAQANVCQFVTYDGAGHEIGFSQLADIQTKAHAFVAEQVLPLHYYRKAA
jgi:predicted esterase